MKPKTEKPPSPVWSKFSKVASKALDPKAGLVFTWLALVGIAGLAIGLTAAVFLIFAGLTLVLVLMLAVAAYMPPTKPFREVSALAARVADLVKVMSGAALFGAAAAYSGIVGTMVSKMSLDDAMSPDVIWTIVWPIVVGASGVGAFVVGARLGWDFQRSDHRTLLLALDKLRLWLPNDSTKRHFVTNWLASIVITGSRGGTFMFVGLLAPLIVAVDLHFGIKLAQAIG